MQFAIDLDNLLQIVGTRFHPRPLIYFSGWDRTQPIHFILHWDSSGQSPFVPVVQKRDSP